VEYSKLFLGEVMDFIFLNIGIVLVALILASYYDLKTKKIPSFVIYPFLIIGFFTMLLNMAELSGTGLFQYSILIFACFFVIIGFLLRNVWLSTGDILLILGIILITPLKFMSINFYLLFFICMGICAMVYYGIIVLTGKVKLQNVYIKYVPCILVGFILAVVAML
jgi:hypothetical protein